MSTLGASLGGQGIGQKGGWFEILGLTCNVPFKSIFYRINVVASGCREAISCFQAIFRLMQLGDCFVEKTALLAMT
jgi:hypothetical protein